MPSSLQFLPAYPPSRLRSILLDALFLLTALIIFGAVLNAVFTRRRDRLRRQQWEEYWGGDYSPRAGFGEGGRRRMFFEEEGDGNGEEREGLMGGSEGLVWVDGDGEGAARAIVVRMGTDERGRVGTGLVVVGEANEEEDTLLAGEQRGVVRAEEDLDAPPRYGEVQDGGRVNVRDFRRVVEEPPAYEEATKGNRRPGRDGEGRAS